MLEIIGVSLIAFGLGLLVGAWWMYKNVYLILASMNKFQLDSLAGEVVAERRMRRAKANS